ncbi:MAG: hypothetical protein A2252_06580 [Elusimicrobia bacterium RIFOXYA2_FULL_39_19]|nr:MAG: hypothetical protein A2252_06580 [Elusimicrobia bacterium RIFOXYA2_FULL_39_19]
MKNQEIADIFYQTAELLSLNAENPFRIRAYEKAAETIESLPESIETILQENRLKKIPGIGEATAEKIKEYIETGKMKYFEDLKKEYPEGILEIMHVPGVGPKKARIIFDKLKIADIKELKTAALEGKLQNLPGFGAKTEQNILKGIALKQSIKGRTLLYNANLVAEAIILQLIKLKEIKNISPAGSLRRKKETVGDIDILCTVEKGKEHHVIEKFNSLSAPEKVQAKGTTKASIITEENQQVDLRVVEPVSFGAALQYFTGSKEHNIALREIAAKKGYILNEYGLFKTKNKKTPVAGKTETEIYEALGLQFIPPELREDRGEIESAQNKTIPKLIEEKDIRGDTHLHTRYSDGANTVEEVAQKAIALGYEWIIICDHSQSLKIANGVSITDLRRKLDEIYNYNAKYGDIKIIAGQEVDILADGSLDYPDEILKNLDFVNVSIHTGFKETEKQITDRVLRAFDNKYVHSLSHPTGRLIGKRAAYAIDMDKVLNKAKENGIFLEINSYPERLDLTDIYCKKAKDMDIKIVIGTDAHKVIHMDYMHLGINVARRGWLTKDDVLNTISYNELMKSLKKRR